MQGKSWTSHPFLCFTDSRLSQPDGVGSSWARVTRLTQFSTRPTHTCKVSACGQHCLTGAPFPQTSGATFCTYWRVMLQVCSAGLGGWLPWRLRKKGQKGPRGGQTYARCHNWGHLPPSRCLPHGGDPTEVQACKGWTAGLGSLLKQKFGWYALGAGSRTFSLTWSLG